MEDAKGLSNAHHTVASKDLCDDSWCCLRAMWMDSTPRTAGWRRIQHGHPGWETRLVTQQGDMAM